MTICFAHPVSSGAEAVAGLHTRTRRRLGVSPALVALYGPVMTTVWMPPAGVNRELTRKSEYASSTPADRTLSTSAAPMVCGPAVTLTRKLRGVVVAIFSPSSVTSTAGAPGPPAPPNPTPPVTLNSYSASSGNVC